MSWFLVYVILGWLIRAAMVPVVLRREFAPGAAVAWLGIVFLHPYIGCALYGMVGEARLGPRRAQRHRDLMAQHRGPQQAAGIDEQKAPDWPYRAITLQAQKIGGLSVMEGNSVDFLTDSAKMVDQLIADIQAARSQVDLLYYIFYPDTTGQRVAHALKEASARGVRCRVIADAVASRVFFHRHGLARPLSAAGVRIVAALPVAPIRRGLPRMDLRNHRKASVIDGQIAYCGSQNLINADYGGRHGGPWYDLTGRFTGPIVTQFATVFDEDWEFESGAQPPPPPPLPAPTGHTAMQVVPTGPSVPGAAYRRILLGAIESARTQLILTTPYFVPDEPTLVALMMAADRGVEVSLILPQRPDHFFTAAAGRAHFTAMLNAGIGIYLYKPGLIHSKTTTVDDAFALFGSANLDVRSYNLNFELSVLCYGQEVTDRLRQVQQNYLAQSDRLDIETWEKRSILAQYGDRIVSLASPLL